MAVVGEYTVVVSGINQCHESRCCNRPVLHMYIALAGIVSEISTMLTDWVP